MIPQYPNVNLIFFSELPMVLDELHKYKSRVFSFRKLWDSSEAMEQVAIIQVTYLYLLIH